MSTRFWKELDFKKLSRDRILGQGAYGTSYLVSLQPPGEKKKDYVLKVQKVLPQEKKLSKKYRIGRELALFRTIQRWPEEKQLGFTRILAYRFRKCPEFKHPSATQTKHPLHPKLTKSKWCLETLTEYGGITLTQIKRRFSRRMLGSLILQILRIVTQLAQEGYLHFDLHAGNLTLRKTTVKLLSYLDPATQKTYRIPTYGYLLTVIDYGEVLNTKFPLSPDFPAPDCRYRQMTTAYQFIDAHSLILDLLLDLNRNEMLRGRDYRKLQRQMIDKYVRTSSRWKKYRRRLEKAHPKTRKTLQGIEDGDWKATTGFWKRLTIEILYHLALIRYSKKFVCSEQVWKNPIRLILTQTETLSFLLAPDLTTLRRLAQRLK